MGDAAGFVDSRERRLQLLLHVHLTDGQQFGQSRQCWGGERNSHDSDSDCKVSHSYTEGIKSGKEGNVFI